MSDHDDLIRLQQQVVSQQRKIEDLERFKEETEALINRGHGAWWMLLKVGLVISTIGAGIWAAWKALAS